MSHNLPKVTQEPKQVYKKTGTLSSLTGNTLWGYTDDGSHFQGMYTLMRETDIWIKNYNVI